MLVARAGTAFVEALRLRSASTHRQFGAIVRHLHPRAVFMHVGAGDCVLALQASGYCERVYAVDPIEEALRRRGLPVNLRFTFSGPGGLGVQAGTVDVAYGGTLDPARLAGIARCLAKGGVYLFPPPRESSARMLRRQLLEAGFASVRLPVFFPVLPRRDLIAAVK